jgi:hypothetical protein
MQVIYISCNIITMHYKIFKIRVMLLCFWISQSYLSFSLISVINFYYVINKLII